MPLSFVVTFSLKFKSSWIMSQKKAFFYEKENKARAYLNLGAGLYDLELK